MSDLVVQVSGGQTREPSRTFSSGAAVGPLGVGSGGEWVVDGPGVGQVHTYLYFDGQSLMVATVPPNVTFLNGSTIGADWTPVSAPCEVTLGAVRLYIQASGAGMGARAPSIPAAAMDEDAATGYFNPQAGDNLPTLPVTSMPQFQRPPGPMKHRGQPPADESTAYRPIEQIRADASGAIPALNASQLGALPPQGQMGPTNPGGPMGPGTPMGQIGPIGPTNPGGPMPPMSQVAPSGMPETMQQPGGPQPGQMAPGVAGDKPPNFWQAAPTPRKILYVLAPIAIIASGVMLLAPDPPAEKPKPKTPKTSVSGSASASSAMAPASAAPMMSAIGAGAVQPVGPLLPAPPRASASAPKRGYPPPKGPPPLTLDRQAVDAVSAGNYAEAVAIYQKLSDQYPDVPAYKEAVRVLKSKVK